MLRTAMFAAVLLFIAPSTRARIAASIQASFEWIMRYQPFSSLVLLLLIGAAGVAVWIVKTAPKWEVPESPMAKYRKDSDVQVDD